MMTEVRIEVVNVYNRKPVVCRNSFSACECDRLRVFQVHTHGETHTNAMERIARDK